MCLSAAADAHTHTQTNQLPGQLESNPINRVLRMFCSLFLSVTNCVLFVVTEETFEAAALMD